MDLTGCPFRKIRIEIDITLEYGWTITRDILNRIDGYAKKGMWDLVEIQLSPSNTFLSRESFEWNDFLAEADIDPTTKKHSDLMYQFLHEWHWKVSRQVWHIQHVLESSSLKGVERRIVLDQCRNWQYKLAHKYFRFMRAQNHEEEDLGMEHPWAFSWLGFPLDWANEARAAFDAEFWLDGKMLPREGSAELIVASARRQQLLKAEYEMVPPDFWEDDSSEEEETSTEGEDSSTEGDEDLADREDTSNPLAKDCWITAVIIGTILAMCMYYKLLGSGLYWTVGTALNNLFKGLLTYLRREEGIDTKEERHYPSHKLGFISSSVGYHLFIPHPLSSLYYKSSYETSNPSSDAP
jgi:hypothetical protein